MNIISKNKLLLFLLVIGLLIGLKQVGGITQCNGEYRLGSCMESNKIYN